jgi:sec-independent protein translocase protein TatA
MGTFSIWHWIIVLAVILLLFGGRGKIPNLMRDMGQGINAFKKGLKEEDKDKAKKEDKLEADTVAEPKKAIETEPAAASATVEEKDTAASG